MAVTTKNLINSLNAQKDALAQALSSQRTDAQRRQQAESEYQSYYDQLRLAQQQAYDTQDLLLQQQRAGLTSGYDRQRENTAKEFAKAYSQSDNQMLGRGMQRSSYAAQTLANIGKDAARAQSDIDAAQTSAEGNIDAQRTQLGAQHNQQMTQYTASQQADVMKRIAELQAADKTNYLNSLGTYNSIVAQIYAMLKNNSSGGSGGRSSSTTKKTTNNNGDADDGISSEDWYNSLFGDGGSGSGSGAGSALAGGFAYGAAQTFGGGSATESYLNKLTGTPTSNAARTSTANTGWNPNTGKFTR